MAWELFIADYENVVVVLGGGAPPRGPTSDIKYFDPLMTAGPTGNLSEKRYNVRMLCELQETCT
jgi:hypothetical protein